MDRRERRAGDHVGRAGADRRGARKGAEAIALAGVAGGDVHHRLFVARRVVRQAIAVLVQRLADAGHVAVAEDAEAAGEEAVTDAVALHLLDGQEADQGLGGCETGLAQDASTSSIATGRRSRNERHAASPITSGARAS